MNNLNHGTIETYIKLLQWAYFNNMSYEELKCILSIYDNDIESCYYCEVVSLLEGE